MAPQWIWLPTRSTGGSDGGTYSKLFRNVSLSSDELLVREVLQNSGDAALQNEDKAAPILTFRFRFRELQGKKKKDFVETLALGSVSNHRKNLEDSRDIPDASKIDALANARTPLRLLYLEDYATHGMSGEPEHDTSSHLRKAFYVLGSADKDKQSSTQGGAFGFGKGAFISASEPQIAIAHTRFRHCDKDPVTQRLIGFTWWGEHSDRNTSFEGRAMFGNAHESASDGARPLVDSAAQKLAQALGMPTRNDTDSQRGSTILILNPLVTPDGILDAVERYWWPALEDHNMDVVVEDYDGTEHVPQPRSRMYLLPFIKAYGIAQGVKKPTNTAEEVLASAPWRADAQGRKYGSLGLVIDKDFIHDQDHDPGVGDMDTPTVALIRGPRMVIEYKSFSSRLPIRGAYVADESIDDELREAEPPAHNSWQHASGAQVSQDSKEVAHGVMNRIRRAVKTFAQEFAPPPNAQAADLPLFGDLLSRHFSGKVVGPPKGGGGGSSPGTKRGLIRISRPDQRTGLTEHTMELTQWFEVQIPKDISWSAGDLTVRFSASIAWDLNSRASEPLALSVTSEGRALPEFEHNAFHSTVKPGESFEFKVQTMPYSTDLTILINPTVELFELKDEHV